ncbi:DUF1848 domain-containing protein [Alkaliphilus peptidifermentans]|uniref:DUF1848 domain-containing protein n=1 Tax=Alkaliphilus peptidifermentans DSM 18978 TaxID=1120976 RepID=A0A1G5KQL4_9FIRM|nr:DUF1848 domain-containing protein [Alkaliphilus peptidifermentans]SCZ02963.1 protein of unknown function [Alkaliphilus peptidifermentans DSM 18978]
MASNKWDTIDIDTNEGRIKGVAPIIISASRSTDIPAFYSEWFINRLREGYVKWVNPFNRRPQYISFDKTRVIVFWTKDAQPIIPHLKEIDNKGISYYFSFTVNDYEEEGFEIRVRKLDKRIDTFKRLSEKIGKDKVIWRFDPLIMTDKITVEGLLDKILKVGNQISDYTNKIVISFADISTYQKVQKNLKQHNINYKEFNPETMEAVAKGLNEINKNWGLDIATCSEGIDLSTYNIKRNKCIDDDLMIKVFSQDKELMRFLGYDYYSKNSQFEEITLFDLVDSNNKPIFESMMDNNVDKSKKLKDKGQRESCGCIVSKDIGQYDTCSNQCIYCYANSSPTMANSNYLKYLKTSRNGESIL